MTLIEAILFAVVYAIASIAPISATAHHFLVPYLLTWEEPHPFFLGWTCIAVLAGIVVHFRHDIASLISSGLQVILFWRKPRTLDERLIFFIGISTAPLALLWIWRDPVQLMSTNDPYWVAGGLFLFSLPMWLGDRMNRRTKNMLNWNWWDALKLGIFQLQILIPGAGRQSGAISSALFSNFDREASLKYVYYSLVPILGAMAGHFLRGFTFHSHEAAPSLSWLNLGVATVVTFFVTLLSLGWVFKAVAEKGFKNFVIYRFLLAAIVVGMAIYRSR